MNEEVSKLKVEIEELKRKLRKSEYECDRLGRLVDSLSKENDRLNREDYSDED